MSNYRIEVLETQPCLFRFGIELPREEVEKETEKVYQILQTRVAVEGFRRGKVPLEIVKQRFFTQARAEVIDNLLTYAVKQILAEKNIKPVTSPRVEKLDFEFEKPFSFQVTVEQKPEFEPDGYKNIRVEKKIKKITEDDVQKVISLLLEQNAYLEESTETVVKKEHFLLVDYELFLPPGSTAIETLKNQLINLSAPDILPGLVGQLVGANKNETKEVKITFPENYYRKEYTGKEAILNVKIYAIKEKKLPMLNDDFARDIGFANLEELNLKIKENLEKTEEQRIHQDMENQIAEHLAKTNPIPLPPSLVEEELQFLLNQAHRYYMSAQVSSSATVDSTALKEKREEEWQKVLPELEKKYRIQAEKRVRLTFIFLAIAEKEKIAIDEDKLREEKIFDFLIKNAKIKTIVENTK